MCKETVLRENIQRHLRDNVALFDCQGGCPDEVAIYEQEHYGETIRTAEYCNECFANQIMALIEETSYKAGKKEGVWAVTEFVEHHLTYTSLSLHDGTPLMYLQNNAKKSAEKWQEFLRGLEG